MTNPLEDHLDYEESEFLEESIGMGSAGCDSIIDGVTSKKYEQNLPSSVPENQNNQETLSNGPQSYQRNLSMPSAMGTASDEWMKAKRLIKVASLFQRRLNKGDRSLSDPEIEIPNEFAIEHLEKQRYSYFYFILVQCFSVDLNLLCVEVLSMVKIFYIFLGVMNFQDLSNHMPNINLIYAFRFDLMLAEAENL